MNLAISATKRLLEEAFNPIFAVVKVSEHTSVYRGFSITRLKRNKITPITRYHVSQGDHSYGKFDAQAQATAYVDQLHQMRNAS
ncbi:hypothetical protein KEM40_08865 [Yersinia sp. Marseille-Q3913]|nr:hypothetical protein [Yersinia sp. Marseille-Q3913]MBS0055553.1 hypothetical protein [Yersinia sp. Marseille-Q3913]